MRSFPKALLTRRPKRLLRGAIIAMLASAATAAVLVHASPAANALSTQTYQLRSVDSGLCLAIPYATSNGPVNPAVLAPCGSSIDRTFRLGDPNTKGRRSLNFATTVCLSGVHPVAAACTSRNDVNQTWLLPPVSSVGAVSLPDAWYLSMCLTYNGISVDTRACDQYPTRWVVEPVAAPRPVKVSLGEGYLCASRRSVEPWGLEIVECSRAGAAALFYEIGNSNGLALVNTAGHGTCIREFHPPVPNGYLSAGPCQVGDLSQVWRHPVNGSLVSESGLCMDTDRHRIDVGIRFIQSTCAPMWTQMYSLIPS